MSELVRDRLESNLTRLGLLTLKEALTSTLDTAQKEAWAYSDLLDRLFEDELANRESRRVRNAVMSRQVVEIEGCISPACF